MPVLITWLYVSFINGISNSFISLYHSEGKPSGPAALLGYKFDIAFLISSSVISLIKSLFCSSPTLGRVVRSKKTSIFVLSGYIGCVYKLL